MQEFEQAKIINAASNQVFDFLSNINNLPQYLPTVDQAEVVDNDEIRIEGQIAGKKYDTTGFFSG